MMSPDYRRAFGVTQQELVKLMENRDLPNHDFKQLFEELGSVSGICDSLISSTENGITHNPKGWEYRRHVFGENRIENKPSKSVASLACDVLKDPRMALLQIFVFTSLILWLMTKFVSTTDDYEVEVADDEVHGWIDSAAILVSMLVVAIISASNNYIKELQFRTLQSKIANTHEAAVIRQGELICIPVTEVVVGDVCQFKCGELVPADGLLIQSRDLKIEEFSYREVIKKNENDIIILSGCRVMHGSGKMLVTAVGPYTQCARTFPNFGANRWDTYYDIEGPGEDTVPVFIQDATPKRLKEIGSERVRTPKYKNIPSRGDDLNSILYELLYDLGSQVGFKGTAIMIFALMIMFTRFSFKTYFVNEDLWEFAHLQRYVSLFVNGIPILLLVAPEGLSKALALYLGYSVKKMMKHSYLVRHLDACETMGHITAICSDKTGSLTTNRMTVVESYICGVHRTKTPKPQDLPRNSQSILSYAIVVNMDYMTQIFPPEKVGEFAILEGNKTDCALLAFAIALGCDYEQIRKEIPEESFTRVYPFNSFGKSMSTVIPRTGGGFRVFTKGASQRILQKCDYIFGADGEVKPFTKEDQKIFIGDVIEPMASKGLRTICLAYRDFVNQRDWDNEDFVVAKLTCLCIVGIEDPIHPDVPGAIKACKRAGITVRMFTGDDIHVARCIAQKCGIISPGDDSIIMDANEFNQRIYDKSGHIQQSRIDQIWPKLRVLAGSSPRDKFNLVNGIMKSDFQKNEVVAVTGAGMHDWRTLQIADVGFVLGLAGTDTAKEASDIILTNDNFASIVKALLWGRNLYDNIGKLVQFHLTVAAVAIVISFVFACTADRHPLKAVQLLWIYLIMDTFAATALATDRATPKLLTRKPFRYATPLVSVSMAKNIFLQPLYMIFVILFLLYFGDKFLDVDNGIITPHPTIHFTMIFNTFVIMILFTEISARKIHAQRNIVGGLVINPVFCIIWSLCFTAQV